MLKLYFFPGACSLAAHVALEETGAPYERKSVDLRGGEQNGGGIPQDQSARPGSGA